MSHLEANDGATLIVSVRCPGRVDLLLQARASVSRPAWISGSIRLAASVKETHRLVRLNSLTPRSSSSARICWLTAPGVTLRSSAALLKLKCRATASKARKALSGGRDRRTVYVSFTKQSCENISLLDGMPIGQASLDPLGIALTRLPRGMHPFAREDRELRKDGCGKPEPNAPAMTAERLNWLPSDPHPVCGIDYKH